MKCQEGACPGNFVAIKIIHVWKSSMPIGEIISIMDCFPECSYPEVVVQVKLPGVSVRGRG